jgi:hypothetical protein
VVIAAGVGSFQPRRLKIEGLDAVARATACSIAIRGRK